MVQTKNKFFEFYNPNPSYKPMKNGKNKQWKLGDCSIRALCCATDMDWISAYRFAADSAIKVFEPFNCSTGFEQVIKDLGGIKCSYPKGQKRETVEEFCKNHPLDIAILNLAGHYVCCKYGKFYDVWDCSQKTAYNYYLLSATTI